MGQLNSSKTMSLITKNIQLHLKKMAQSNRTPILQSFFKTGKGLYAEGDVFIGVTVPNQRKVAKVFATGAKPENLSELLDSHIHEHRLTALLIMTYQWVKARKHKDNATMDTLYKLYFQKMDRINNWDLVDVSAPMIVGEYMLDHPAELKKLDKLISSKNMWERRIALLASFAFIKVGRTDITTNLAEKVLHDKEDLIHKASGWMLREMGKRASVPALIAFLDKYAKRMPRTMLRYAIEHLSGDQKSHYMAKL
jgi:3-methyladenine DNA glycosylase AlkD